MNLGTPVLDLSNVVSALTSFGIAAAVLAGARILFLDDWLSGLSPAKQNVWLVIANIVLNFLLILGFSALLFGIPFGPDLLRGSVIATLGIAAPAGHFTYNGVKNLVATRLNAPADGSYPIYPPDGGVDASALADEPIPPAVTAAP